MDYLIEMQPTSFTCSEFTALVRMMTSSCLLATGYKESECLGSRHSL